MRLRTAYDKVTDMEAAVTFWENMLDHPPAGNSALRSEFTVGVARLGPLLNDSGEDLVGYPWTSDRAAPANNGKMPKQEMVAVAR